MYVVGNYILVEPFKLPKESALILQGTAEKGQISTVGKVVSVGEGPEVKDSFEIGHVVHLMPGPFASQIKIGAKQYYKATIEGVAICYANRREFERVQKEEKEEDRRIAALERVSVIVN